MTFGEAYDIFKKEHISKKKPRTQYDYKRVLKAYFLPPFKTRKLATLTYEDVIAQTVDCAPREKDHALATARVFFRWWCATYWEWLC
ncbi:MAG TPA: hypothetical protein VGL34_23985 [Steroidobacteraceae bacterium]|jgi:hypothetical protein